MLLGVYARRAYPSWSEASAVVSGIQTVAYAKKSDTSSGKASTQVDAIKIVVLNLEIPK